MSLDIAEELKGASQVVSIYNIATGYAGKDNDLWIELGGDSGGFRTSLGRMATLYIRDIFFFCTRPTTPCKRASCKKSMVHGPRPTANGLRGPDVGC